MMAAACVAGFYVEVPRDTTRPQWRWIGSEIRRLQKVNRFEFELIDATTAARAVYLEHAVMLRASRQLGAF